ncbi:MAG TPA: hypothetical protein VNP92_15020 [Actinophytocola sp.]|nr:hypothetical protein [Actinophytocola sp.]
MRTRVVAVVAAALAMVGLTAPVPASAQAPTLGEVVISGLHNSYQKSAFAHLTDALGTGVGMIEIDVWTTFSSWTVNHDHPFWNGNNCTSASGSTDQGLETCVDNIKSWHDSDPDHQPLLIKLELKAGFQDDQGVGPDELDAVFDDRLGSAMYRPADLMGGAHGTPDAAAAANAWGAAADLRGRVILMVLKGTVENDDMPTEVEYARHLSANPASAVAFPFVHDGIGGADPRTRYDAALRPWFVVFDGGANTFANLTPAQRAFYVDNHYLTVTTNSHEVAPALDANNPTPQQAADRLRLLGCLGSSVASSDWYQVPDWHRTEPRGC